MLLQANSRGSSHLDRDKTKEQFKGAAKVANKRTVQDVAECMIMAPVPQQENSTINATRLVTLR